MHKLPLGFARTLTWVKVFFLQNTQDEANHEPFKMAIYDFEVAKTILVRQKCVSQKLYLKMGKIFEYWLKCSLHAGLRGYWWWPLKYFKALTNEHITKSMGPANDLGVEVSIFRRQNAIHKGKSIGWWADERSVSMSHSWSRRRRNSSWMLTTESWTALRVILMACIWSSKAGASALVVRRRSFGVPEFCLSHSVSLSWKPLSSVQYVSQHLSLLPLLSRT